MAQGLKMKREKRVPGSKKKERSSELDEAHGLKKEKARQ